MVAAEIRFAVNSRVNSPPWCVRADDGVHRSLLFNAEQSPSPDRCSPAGSRNASAWQTLTGVNMTFTVTRPPLACLGEAAAPTRLAVCVCVGLLALATRELLEAHDHAKAGAVSPRADFTAFWANTRVEQFVKWLETARREIRQGCSSRGWLARFSSVKPRAQRPRHLVLHPRQTA